MTDTTSVIISHRISSVKHANRILVLAAGEIIEQGTHAELMKFKGDYYATHQKQLLEEENSTVS